MEQLFIGVDGGGTKTNVRVEDETGRLLGQASGGPANIRLSVEQSWQSINAALETILQPLGLSLTHHSHPMHAGMGLAGCEIKLAYQHFLRTKHTFDTLMLTSDAYAACMGAHGGEDGAIIVIGTGVVGFQTEKNQTARVGGWGFPHDDQGGGAWLGLQAVRQTLSWCDGRMPVSGLVQMIYEHFNNDVTMMVNWANQANSSAFASIAPMVIAQMQEGDAVAIDLIQRAAAYIDRIDAALESAQVDKTNFLPRALSGGIAEFVEPYLSARLRENIVKKKSTPDKGAILMLRKKMLLTQGAT